MNAALDPKTDTVVRTISDSPHFQVVSYLGEEFTFAKRIVRHTNKIVECTFGSFREKTWTKCPVCGDNGRCYRDVEKATGEKLLSGYRPEYGEIVQNHWSECRACGWNQAS